MNLSVFGQLQKQMQQLVTQLGTINAGLYLVNRLASLFAIDLSIYKYYLVAQLLREQSLLPGTKGRQLRIVELRLEDLDPHPCPRPVGVIADRYAQGAICLSAYKGDEFAGCLCMSNLAIGRTRCVVCMNWLLKKQFGILMSMWNRNSGYLRFF